MKIIENRKKFFAVSLILILAGFAAMMFHNSAGRGMLNWDVDFTGGTSMELDMGGTYDQDQLAKMIEEVTGQKSAQIQEIVGTNEVVIKMQSIDSVTRETLLEEISTQFPGAEMQSSADVSGTVSNEMQGAALKATLIACLAMLVYISFRFRDVRAGSSAIAALLHDVLIVLAAYAILRIPVNNSFIAVLLTILGYSVNSTIVIFDRVRENKQSYHSYQTAEKINKSIGQTLARSINTSLTTLFTIGAIYFLGVQSIKEFALPMMVGVIAGAYSSICISGSIWYCLLPKTERE